MELNVWSDIYSFTPFCLTSVSLQPHCQLWLLPTTLLGRQQRNFRVSLREWKIDANPVDSKSMNPQWLYLVNCNHLAQEMFTNWTNPQRKSWNTDLSDLAVEWGWLMGTDGALETWKKKTPAVSCEIIRDKDHEREEKLLTVQTKHRQLSVIS